MAGPPSLSLSFPAGLLGLPSVHSRTGPVGSCSLGSASSLPRPSPLACRSAHASAATRARPLSNDCHLGPARQPYSSRASAVLSPVSRACVSPTAMWPPHVGAFSPHNCIPRAPALCRCHTWPACQFPHLPHATTSRMTSRDSRHDLPQARTPRSPATSFKRRPGLPCAAPSPFP